MTFLSFAIAVCYVVVIALAGAVSIQWWSSEEV
jgi:hypothetical protein